MKTIRHVQQALLTTIATISLLVCCTKTDTELPEWTKEDYEDQRYMAIRQCHEGGATCQSRTPLYQKLIFVKNDTLNTIFSYLLSLIPDKDYYVNHGEENMADNFINLGDKGGFSGLAIYTTLPPLQLTMT